MNYELIGIVIAIIGIVVSIWQIQRKNIQEFQRLTDKEEQNEKDVATIRRDIESIVVERTHIVKEMYAKLEKVEEMHISDVKEMNKLIADTVDKVKSAEAKHHDEIICELRTIGNNLAKLSGEWQEYRRSHNGNENKETAK